jgi:hypothetical protein
MTRHGTFSSSSAWKLMTNDRSGKPFGAPGLRYIKQVNYERRLGRAINPERDSRPTTWGTFVERRAFDLLPIDYSLVSKKRLFHPSLPEWSGAPDLVKEKTVADCKCPYTLDSFCGKIEALQDIQVYKDEYPEDYWQHISNACLLQANGFPVTHFEAIIYTPYKSELDIIRDMATNYNGDDQYRFKWISFSNDEELPYLIEGLSYQNLNVLRFEVPTADKLALHNRIELAKELIQPQISKVA